jgi:hypothetical protein
MNPFFNDVNNMILLNYDIEVPPPPSTPIKRLG